MYENESAATAVASDPQVGDLTVVEVLDAADDDNDDDGLAEAIVEESEEDLLDEPATVIDTVITDAEDGSVEEVDETVLDGRGEVISSSVQRPVNADELARTGDADDDNDDALAGAGIGLGDLTDANEIAI